MKAKINTNLIPHPTHPQKYGVFSKKDWNGIVWYMTCLVPNFKSRDGFLTKMLVLELIARITKPLKQGYNPGIRKLSFDYRTTPATILKLHNHLISFLKEIGYWRKGGR